MIIETPIYFIKAEGNIKEYAKQLPCTIIASYEDYIDTTYIVVAADENNYSEEVKKQYKNLHSDYTKKGNKFKFEITYSKNGIDFKTINDL